MFNEMLVPLDGSAMADRALSYAESLARAAGGRLLLLRAVDVWALTDSQRLERERELIPQAERELAAVVSAVGGRGITAGAAVTVGEPAAGIAQAATASETDLIVMSTHGRSGVGRWAYGSVAERVLRLSTKPVLLVPASCERGWDNLTRRRVLVTLDGSPMAEAALQPAIELARLLGAELTLLHAVDPPVTMYAFAPVYPYAKMDEWVTQARTYLEDVVSRVRAEGLPVEAQTVVGYAATSIVGQVNPMNTVAIVMATHSGLSRRRTALGSVTLGVVHRVSVPVLTIRPLVRETVREAVRETNVGVQLAGATP